MTGLIISILDLELFEELFEQFREYSSNGDLERVKQICAFVHQENISLEEMGVETNDINDENELTIIDYNCGTIGESTLMDAASKERHLVCDHLVNEYLRAVYHTDNDDDSDSDNDDNDENEKQRIEKMRNRTEILKFLIQQKGNLEARDNDQNLFLIYAACWNNKDLLKVLLNYNVNVNVMFKDNRGLHAAYVAAAKGHLKALKMLVEKDEAVVDLKAWNGETPLIAASKSGMFDVCEYLVGEKNADINIKDNVGKTALQHVQNQLTNDPRRIIYSYSVLSRVRIIEILKNKFHSLSDVTEEKERNRIVKKL